MGRHRCGVVVQGLLPRHLRQHLSRELGLQSLLQVLRTDLLLEGVVVGGSKRTRSNHLGSLLVSQPLDKTYKRRTHGVDGVTILDPTESRTGRRRSIAEGLDRETARAVGSGSVARVLG